MHKKLLKQIPWAYRITIEENLEDMRRKRAVETQMIVWHAIQSIQKKPSVFQDTCQTFHDIPKDNNFEEAYAQNFLKTLNEYAKDGLCIRFFHIRPEIIVAYHHGNPDEKSFFSKKITEIIFERQKKNNDILKISMQTGDNVLRYRPIEITTKEKMYYLDQGNPFSLLPLSFLFPLTIPGHFFVNSLFQLIPWCFYNRYVERDDCANKYKDFINKHLNKVFKDEHCYEMDFGKDHNHKRVGFYVFSIKKNKFNQGYRRGQIAFSPSKLIKKKIAYKIKTRSNNRLKTTFIITSRILITCFASYFINSLLRNWFRKYFTKISVLMKAQMQLPPKNIF
ncbi:hypothetical protein IPH25_00400 [bacterium]|nr:MAG: hypothetical protein IPG37_02515 [bacterium]QQR61894.1 MAG: hypothetical protein IPH25_00400 [bacterium]QQR62520.1 MAG: hypothetical protein IPH67_03810 [bacterium]